MAAHNSSKPFSGDKVLRRNFISLFAGSAAFSWFGLRSGKVVAANVAFDHGVASGDPLSDRVMLWTRVSGAVAGEVDVRWTIAADAEMRSVISEGVVRTD